MSNEKSIPSHVAIIMDGNGRWASARGFPRSYGHKKGADSVQAVTEAASDLGVKYLTLYAFSDENWSRPKDEVSSLMGLAERYIAKHLKELHAKGVRFKAIGNRHKLPISLQSKIEEAEKLTSNNTKFYLNIALSYSAKSEMVRAVKAISAAVKEGSLEADNIDADVISNHLFTANMPDVDLLIRTSGEQRLSNFLLWQSAYAELHFVEKHWPDFKAEDFKDAIDAYLHRERRFGHVESV